jgi:hypothetical protein
MKNIIVSLCLVVASLFAGATVESYHAKGSPLAMKTGTYEAYSVQKRFDVHTGEPVYWVIGSPIQEEAISDGKQSVTVPVIHGEPKFYEVSRRRVTNLPSNASPDPDFNYRGQIIVQ